MDPYLRNNYLNLSKKSKQNSSDENENAHDDWEFFCDFPEITVIDLNESNVRISTQLNQCLVRVLVYLSAYELKYIHLIGKCACNASVGSINQSADQIIQHVLMFEFTLYV